MKMLFVAIGILLGTNGLLDFDGPPSWGMADGPVCGPSVNDVTYHKNSSGCEITKCFFDGATLVFVKCEATPMTCKMYNLKEDGTAEVDECPAPEY